MSYVTVDEDAEAEGYYHLAMAYLNGDIPDVPFDPVEAERLLKQAIAYYHLEATLTLARLYQHGANVLKDLKESARLYEIAAIRGNSDAQFELGNLYSMGLGLSADQAKCMYWWNRSALKGNEIAQKALLMYLVNMADYDTLANLGRLYYEKGYQSLAISTWETGAEHGSLACQYSLGLTLHSDTLRRSEGMEWLEKAAAGGSEEAKNAILRVYETESIPDSIDSV